MSGKKILIFDEPSSDKIDNGEFVNGLWAIRQYVNGATNTNNFELVSVSNQSSFYTSKEFYTSSGPEYSVGPTTNNSIIDPVNGPIRELTIIGSTQSAIEGSSWIVSFGGSNITAGPVIYNLIWEPSTVFGGIGANQAEAGDGYLLVYDSFIGKWRLY